MPSTLDKPVLAYSVVNGAYVLHQGFKPVRQPISEVAVCIDTMGDGLLMKHGAPGQVAEHAQELRKMKRAVHSATGDILVVQGTFPVDDLNRLIANPTSANRFLQKHFPDGILLGDGTLA